MLECNASVVLREKQICEKVYTEQFREFYKSYPLVYNICSISIEYTAQNEPKTNTRFTLIKKIK